jgi:hypothetical protein
MNENKPNIDVTKLPRVNVYLCEYNCHTVTVDVDKGTTPFMIGCRARSTKERPIGKWALDEDGFCKGTAKSNFYPKLPMPPWIKPPAWEWYKPTQEEYDKLPAKEKDDNHFAKGGLFLRPRTDKAALYHE